MVKKILGAVGLLLLSVTVLAQNPGAIKTQEIFSSTSHVKIDNATDTPVTVVTFASPTNFNANLGEHFVETLTGDVTSSTLSNAATGQNLYFKICQDGMGSHTFAWPANFLNAPTIIATASACTNLVGFYDGTNFNVTGKWDTGGGGGSVTSVGMTGDGVVYQPSVTGSPITSAGTLAPQLANVNTGNVLAGPIGGIGSNVSVRQTKVAALSNPATPITMPNVATGSLLIILWNQTNNVPHTISDSLGTTLAIGVDGTIGYASGVTVASGNDVITFSGDAGVNNNGLMYITEVLGATGIHAATGCTWVNNNTCSFSFTPGASTDGVISMTFANTWKGASTTSYSTSPVMSTINTYSVTPAGGGVFNGKMWFYIPGATTSQTVQLNSTLTSNLGDFVGIKLFDLTQSSTAGSAPWVARRLTESDLPASAVSAIQSVNNYNLALNKTITGINTANTLISQAVTMPSEGCPCRIQVSYTMYTSAPGTSALTIEMNSWVTDGTNSWAAAQTTHLQDTALDIPDDQRSLVANEYSPVSYANDQSVTLTLNAAADHDSLAIIQVNPFNSASPVVSHMQVSILQSRN